VIRGRAATYATPKPGGRYRCAVCPDGRWEHVDTPADATEQERLQAAHDALTRHLTAAHPSREAPRG